MYPLCPSVMLVVVSTTFCDASRISTYNPMASVVLTQVLVQEDTSDLLLLAQVNHHPSPVVGVTLRAHIVIHQASGGTTPPFVTGGGGFLERQVRVKVAWFPNYHLGQVDVRVMDSAERIDPRAVRVRTGPAPRATLEAQFAV
eukprot:CAMPEP_0119209272 /NCGR_PEP_ID=MMETSP1327-20130426/1330_1 /TAXON_ID=38833 /ORGANISM="Micromonas pusilla, Strain RCC2306" /LENGTH=142 /DNA_ID=CAMNT_0007206065 /DNA_START=54 /DNA_END=481 /DNA_ORIENTATION=-